MPEEHIECGKYLIDNQVVFSPGENLLINLNTRDEVLIKKQASLCLLYLIKNYNEIMTQSDLLAFAWGEYHRDVSFNTFYQYILSIRKSFTVLGVTKQIITTIPRKGLVIQDNIMISDFDEPSFSLISPPEENTSVKVISDYHKSKPRFSIAALRLFYLRNKNSLVVILITIAASMIYLFNVSNNVQYFSSYHEYKITTNDCTIYFNSDTRSTKRHENFMAEHQEYCSSNKFIYVTAHEDAKNISVFVCSEKIGVSLNNDCHSIYYPESKV